MAAGFVRWPNREPWLGSLVQAASVGTRITFKITAIGIEPEDRSPCQFEPFAFSFPLTAIVSISSNHRHSLAGGFALYVLDMALASAQGFAEAQRYGAAARS